MEKLVFNVEKCETPVEISMGESFGEHSFGCNSRYLEKDNKPWLPVMAEFHFSRYDRDEWETELLKIKAADIDIVSSYLFWIFHEEEEGSFRFDGKRDIAYFCELCRKVGLYVFVRIGPWCHGECRNGGFPDWLQHSGIELRCNDERYLGYVRRLFSAYAGEISPYLFGNGGTIIGIQLENELTDNSGHLDSLKKIALDCGLKVPYYTVTGWGQHVTEFPDGEMLPVFGCYPAAPWEGHTGPLGINKNYFFSTVRNDSSIGSDRLSGKVSDDEQILKRLPHLTCELGPGNQLTYHRRPSISTMDAVALATVSLGSGNNLPGYYMFHGGFNPAEGLYQESKASGYSNDLPVSSYDFQAPLDEFGQPRESWFYLKRLHQFVHCCEKQLAAASCFSPDRLPSSLNDSETPRMFFRGDEKGGFLFFNTHQRNSILPPVENLNILIKYNDNDSRSYGVPHIPSGCCGVFPVRCQYGNFTAEFMTAMPLWTGEYEGSPALVCAAYKEIAPTFEFRGVVSAESSLLYDVCVKNGNTVISFSSWEKTGTVRIRQNEAVLDIMLLNEEDSLHFYPIKTEEGTRLIFRDGIVYSQNGCAFSYEKICKPENLPGVTVAKAEENRIGKENIYSEYLFSDPAECPEYILDIPEYIAEKCYDAVFFFKVRGDVIQLYADDILIADDFLRSDSWRVSLRRVLPYIKKGKILRIKCSPVKADRDIYLDKPVGEGIMPPELTDIVFTDIVEVN